MVDTRESGTVRRVRGQEKREIDGQIEREIDGHRERMR